MQPTKGISAKLIPENGTSCAAAKCTQSGYPDIEIFKTSTDKPDLYIEVKVQRRTFMTVKKLSQIVFYTHRRQLLLI
jgi:hypothetical protein